MSSGGAHAGPLEAQSMNADQLLDAVHRKILPPDEELKRVREALDLVEGVLARAGAPWPVAERYPCGSYAKATMLRGRMEADLVLTLAQAPEERTLTQIAGELHRALITQLKGPPQRNYKSIELRFGSGARVDVLPIALPGRTADAELAPPKLRHARSGPEHVRWFKAQAHGRPAHMITRLVKRLRDLHPPLRALSSFSLEVLTVQTLAQPPARTLSQGLDAVLGVLAGPQLPALRDPADPSNLLLAELDAATRQRIAQEAARLLAALRSARWAQLFPGDV